jgi:PAS domain-containing protein
MSVFFVVKTAVLFEIIPSTRTTRGIEYITFLSFIPIFTLIIREIKGTQTKKLNDTDKFIDKAAIISITDEKGRITYVNDKFEKVSGWKLEEVVGKDHSIVN